MDLSPYVTRLREDLTAAAAAGDEQTQRTAAVLSTAIEPAARLAIMNALADLAAEVTAQLGDQVVDVRVDGRDVGVAVTGSGQEAGTPADEESSPSSPPPESGDISRITLRLLDEIKGQAEQAASTQGVSLNTWVAQAVQGALRGRRSWDRGRTGWSPHGGVWTSGGWHRSGETNKPETGQDGAGSRLHGWVEG